MVQPLLPRVRCPIRRPLDRRCVITGETTMRPCSGRGSPTTDHPLAGVSQPPSNDARVTYTYDVPWDWAHRFPPAVAPSDRPYVSSCPAESVTVPGADGAEKTVNIMRCY